MTEDQLKANVIELAEWLGYRVYSIRRSDRALVQGRTGKGWPDLFMVRHGRAIAAELKSARGRLTKSQWGWLEELAKCGVDCHVWKPKDWLDGSIERMLKGELR